MAKKSKTPEGKLKEELWQLNKKVADKLFGTNCYTCGAKKLKGANKQLGHFLPSMMCGNYLRYDIRNLRNQCMRCNCHAGGYGAAFYRNMVKIEGQEYVDSIFKDLKKKCTLSKKELQRRIDELSTLL